jgi:NadR type nicotinamide-nucleotide adenylyltransferase
MSSAEAKPFQRGLVVGKFSPLHRGHEFLIQRAFEMCQEVVLISYSNPELPGCEAYRREQWLAHLFPQARRLVVSEERFQLELRNGEFQAMPPNDAAHSVHRRFTGFLCSKVLGVTVDAVFTSEDYGDGFARELTDYFHEQNFCTTEVRHILVDQERRKLPVSATMIRNDIHRNRHWLSPAVYASFVRRVCILGGESSGKSTLAKALAEHFETVHVPEYGRELWGAKNGGLVFEDMLHIAQTQIARENQACLEATRFVFCDTSPLTTAFYSQHMFKRIESELERLAERPYDLVALCAADFGFVQDGTRQDATFREHQNKWYVEELTRRGIPFLSVTGSLAGRVVQVVEQLHKMSESQLCQKPAPSWI